MHSVDGEKNATVYIRSTVAEALELAHADLTSYYRNLDAYAIAYDGGWRDQSGVEHRASIVEIEEETAPSPHRIAYRLSTTPDGILAFTSELFEFPSPDWSLFHLPNESERNA